LDEAAIRLPTDPLPAFLTRHARADPRRTALVFYGREVSYGELDESSDRFAGWLRARGLRPGDRVALFLENCPQFAIAYMGALKAGAVNVCLNPVHKARELQRDLADSGARVLVTADLGGAVVEAARAQTGREAVAATRYADYLPETASLPVPPSFREVGVRPAGAEDFRSIVADAPRIDRHEPRAPGDTALLQYTSGTTGAPKGAEITHGNLVANCELQKAYIGLGESEVVLAVLPW